MGGRGSSGKSSGGGGASKTPNSVANKNINQLRNELDAMEQRAFEGKNYSQEYMRDVMYTLKVASNPESASVGTKLSMGGYNYTKNSNGTWTTFGPTGKRLSNRTNADIHRVFT